jgi:pimeloyl-ACP methyl ester carboxylesterase
MEEGTLSLEGLRIRYIKDGGGKPVVLLHGYSFNADNWFSSGVAQSLAESYAVYAVDMPYGAKSKSSKFRSDARGYAKFLRKVLDALSLGEPPIVGPSMSGEVLMWYVALGYRTALAVLVGPVGLDDRELQAELARSGARIAAIWGEKDEISPPSVYAPLLKKILPSAQVAVLPGAGHPAYLDRPREFLELLRGFLAEAGY